MSLLTVKNLGVELLTHAGPARALRDVSFELERGSTMGLVGESGCGKSMTALALMGLLPDGSTSSGSARFDGIELTDLDEGSWCQLRGARIAMIFQEPMTSLNPLHRVGNQIVECLRIHGRVTRGEARAEAGTLLERVGIADAVRRLADYPHQFSGGQRQRVMIAMALANKPDLLIADEPTTALDVTVQKQILDLIRSLVDDLDMAMLLISHDLGVIAQHTEHMAVMYGGTVVEQGRTERVLGAPAHPYTRGLLGSLPRPGQRGRLRSIPGTVPQLSDLGDGCPFVDRCSEAIDSCGQHMPGPSVLAGEHSAACVHLDVGHRS
jgi:peptide/nickel transport system ATP-binding protein